MVQQEIERRREIIRPLTQRHESPVYFSIDNLQPRYARRRSTIGSGHATGIQKQHAAASLISWHVRVTMQNNIDIVRRALRWNVLQAKFYSAAREVDNQRPFEIAVAISAHHRHGPTGCAQFIKDPFRTDIAQMPDFIGIPCQRFNYRRQTIVSVGYDENTKRAFRLFCLFHVERSRDISHRFVERFFDSAQNDRRLVLRPLREALIFHRVI